MPQRQVSTSRHASRENITSGLSIAGVKLTPHGLDRTERGLAAMIPSHSHSQRTHNQCRVQLVYSRLLLLLL
jgi:hypothetical protein